VTHVAAFVGISAIVICSGLILRPRVRRALDTLTGLTLVAFGVRLAAERA
jgi:threonine/homoserine/homoserine lactone efflux protein